MQSFGLGEAGRLPENCSLVSVISVGEVFLREKRIPQKDTEYFHPAGFFSPFPFFHPGIIGQPKTARVRSVVFPA